MPDQKLLFKGHLVKPADLVRATDALSGAVTFYRVVRVWGHHGTFQAITEEEAGANPISISVQGEVER